MLFTTRPTVISSNVHFLSPALSSIYGHLCIQNTKIMSSSIFKIVANAQNQCVTSLCLCILFKLMSLIMTHHL